MAKEWNHLYIQTAAGNVTGSIEKECAGHATDTVTIASWVTGTFKSLTYSDGTTADATGSQNNVDTIGTDNLTLDPAKGQCLDGPFISLHGNGNTLLVYHNGLANVVTD